MGKLVKWAWGRRRILLLACASLIAGLAGFHYAISLDEGTGAHIKKQFVEASRMPGRLLT